MNTWNHEKVLERQIEVWNRHLSVVGAVDKPLAERMAKNFEVLQANDFTGVYDCESTLDEQAYHHGIGISKSQITHAKKSGRKWYSENVAQYVPETGNQRDNLKLGDAIHKAILEPHLLDSLYISDQDIITKIHTMKEGVKSVRSTAEYRKFVAAEEAKGHAVMKYPDWDMMKAIVDRVNAHPVLAKILPLGQAEKVVYARDPDTGLVVRCKPDLLIQDGVQVDLKSCIDASPWQFSKTVFDFGYHLQAASYRKVVRWAGLPAAEEFLFVALEKSPPYDLAIYNLDQGSMDLGETEYRENLDRIAGWMLADKFPGYPIKIQSLALPPWAWYRD